MLSFGVMFPIGSGIIMYLPVFCAYEWFPDHKVAVTTSIFMAYGMGVTTFSTISTAIANPNNASIYSNDNDDAGYFPRDVADRVPSMLYFIAALQILLSVISISLTKRKV